MNGTTKFLCDVIRCQLGKLPVDTLRKQYAQGHYPGLPADWARLYGALVNLRG